MDAHNHNPNQSITDLARAALGGDRVAGADLVLRYCVRAINFVCIEGKAARMAPKLADMKGTRREEVIADFMVYVVEKRIRVIADMVLNRGCDDADSLCRCVASGKGMYRAFIDFMRAEKARLRMTTGYAKEKVSFTRLEEIGRGGKSAGVGEDEANPDLEMPDDDPFAAEGYEGGDTRAADAPAPGMDALEVPEESAESAAGYGESAVAVPAAEVPLEELIKAAEENDVRACCIAFLNDERPCEADDFAGLLQTDTVFQRRLADFRRKREQLGERYEKELRNACRRVRKLQDEMDRFNNANKEVPDEIREKSARAKKRVEETLKTGVRRVGERDIAALLGIEKAAARNLLKRAKRHMQRFVEDNL